MSTPVEWSPEDFAARLKQRSQERRSHTTVVDPERADFRRAAALLSTFDPRRLRTPRIGPGGAVLHLVEDATSLSGHGVLLWRLRTHVREEALRSFTGPEQALEYLELNVAQTPDPSTARFTLALLLGRPPDLARLDIDDLARVRKAVSWLRLVPGTGGLPDESEIEWRLERGRLLEPLRELLRQPFEGRRDELLELQKHIGLVLPPRRKAFGFRRRPRAVRDPHGDYPLVIHGPGGIGKSTLLARSLLDHLTDQSLGRFPFVYVDSERATVWLHEPMSLVAEMARQLAVQYPSARDAFTALSATARVRGREQRARMEDLGDLREVTTTRSIGRVAAQEYHVVARDDDSMLTQQLGRILQQAVATEGSPGSPLPPFLVALDSFEEAQYRASPVLDRMWAMLTALRSAYPHTCVIVAGRAPVGHPNIRTEDIPTLELGELDAGAAEQFLVDRGVGPVLARAVYERVGGNPLSLQLAAKVAAARRAAQRAAGEQRSDAELDEWISSVPTKRRRFFGAVDDMLIQGMLYDRLLMHITDPEVRELAHPGLVLRRITPELIRVVLAPHVKVDMSDPGAPWRLFEELARELDLVDRVAPDVLRHRPDVRKVMLRLLAADKTKPVRWVERGAIAYYAHSDRPEDRAEELYHRLRLGERLGEVKDRWLPEVAPYLTGCEDELPSRSARLLNRLLQGTPETIAPDDQFEWEQHTAEEVENLLTQDFVDEALVILDRRRPWTTCSPLHAVHAEALLRQGRTDEAREAVSAALVAQGMEQCGETYLELLLLSARISAEAGDLDAADDDLDVAESTARRLGNDLDALGVLLQRAHLHEDASSPHDAVVESELVARVEAMPDGLLSTRPALFRAVAAEVGVRAPAVLSHAVNLVGLPPLSSGKLRVLASAILAMIDDPTTVRILAALAEEEPTRWTRPTLDDVERLLGNARTTGQLDEVAKHLLAIEGHTEALREALAAAMVEGLAHVVKGADVPERRDG